jgi:uncharacterized membrane protein YhaH (DUF805 family)
MTVFTSIKTVFRKYADFNGRAARAEYWWFVLLNALVLRTLTIFPGANGFVLTTIWTSAVLIPFLAVATRRLHDTGRSAKWLPLLLVPILGWITMFVIFAQAGTQGENKYDNKPAKKVNPAILVALVLANVGIGALNFAVMPAPAAPLATLEDLKAWYTKHATTATELSTQANWDDDTHGKAVFTLYTDKNGNGDYDSNADTKVAQTTLEGSSELIDIASGPYVAYLTNSAEHQNEVRIVTEDVAYEVSEGRVVFELTPEGSIVTVRTFTKDGEHVDTYPSSLLVEELTDIITKAGGTIK